MIQRVSIKKGMSWQMGQIGSNRDIMQCMPLEPGKIMLLVVQLFLAQVKQARFGLGVSLSVEGQGGSPGFAFFFR
jgi:hypothetical protein